MKELLAPQLQKVEEDLATAPDNIKHPILHSKVDFAKEFELRSIIKVGRKLPDFKLPDANGDEVSSTDLLAQGPLLITFYRGGWCPFCNLALRALQKHLDDIKSHGANLVAISPELPDTSLTTAQKNELSFPVLSDIGLRFARKLGIVWKQPDTLRPVFEIFENDLKARNGDNSFEVPVPVTLLVGRDGIVRNVFAESDYAKRVEPQEVIYWLTQLNS
ncbi:hypothetical protein NECHADRAFT_78070 [Paecilomyces variotii No. 5]|uniref:thioredoxin-dependent peroxiredoxin n=1 Tax=Byssochlamys spectabilis (strain No. 5 / NBRC 109023) TaxID=1356009 RepID=V5HVH5_BYSSN|nr:hypothetical protein NECHADRAFT_78070 [Paecilomyces variotii No. 5]